MKVLVATEKPFAAVAVNGIKEILDNAGVEMVLLEKYPDKAALLKAVEDVEGLIVRSDIVDAEVFDAAPKLKIVVRAGAGYDNIDLNAATAKGVCVMNPRTKLQRCGRARVRYDYLNDTKSFQRNIGYGIEGEKTRNPCLRTSRS